MKSETPEGVPIRPPRFQSFEEFWPYYVGEHRRPGCRAMHYLGATVAVGLLIASIVLRDLAWLLAIPLASYGLAWIAHALIERNRPATWSYVLYSLRGEFRMFRLFLSGKMRAELIRLYGSTKPAKDVRLRSD